MWTQKHWMLGVHELLYGALSQPLLCLLLV
jgi:hypothetical protein